MTLSRTSLVLISLCLGLLAALLTFGFLARNNARVAGLSRRVKVVITTRPIAARSIIDASEVISTTRPAGSLPPNSVALIEEVIGQVAMTALPANEPVPRTALAPPTVSLGMAYAVPPHMRAVAVALDQLIGVGGFLQPGDHVDVVATFTVNEMKVTKTVLQDVLLLAIGANVQPEDINKPVDNKNSTTAVKQETNATLAVTPDQAEKLILAETGGKLRLTMRAQGDDTHVTLSGVRSDVLTGVRSGGRSDALPPAPNSGSPATMPTTYHDATPSPHHAQTSAENHTLPSQPDVLHIETIRGTVKTSVDVGAK